MVTLDNLVVTNALVSIREDLGASLEELEWTVNAYTLQLRGLPVDRRRARRPARTPARCSSAGIGIFTVASAAAALAPTTEALIAARALQGLGGAVITPLSLTLLSEAFAGGQARARARHLVGRVAASASRSARSSAARSSRASRGSGSSG